MPMSNSTWKRDFALAVEEIEARRRAPAESLVPSALQAIGDRGRIHQNTSAGSTAITRRIASAAETRHIPSVNAKLIAVTSSVMCSGISASSPMMW